MTTDARLRALVAVADTGSVHGAAGRLVITDSAVSAALAALTREVGVPLLEREGRGLRLTPSGRTYAGYARAILGLHEEALAAARGDADPEHGRVRVAAVTTAAEHIVPPPLATFRDRHPGVGVSLEVGPSDHVWGLLASWGVDLVIAGRPPRSLDVAVRAVRPNALVVVGAPGMAGASDVLRVTWLMREAGSGTRASCEALLAALDAEPPTLTLGSNGAVVAGAVAGLGVSLVSRDAVVGPLASGDLVELSVPQTPMARPWHAVTPPRAAAAAKLLVDHLLAQDGPARVAGARPAPAVPGAAQAFTPVILPRGDVTGRAAGQPGDMTNIAQGCREGRAAAGDQGGCGAEPLPGATGETVTEGPGGRRERLGCYVAPGARSGKWRAAYLIGGGRPSWQALACNLAAVRGGCRPADAERYALG